METARKIITPAEPTDEERWRRNVAARPEAAGSVETTYCTACSHPICGVNAEATDPATGHAGRIHEGCLAVEGLEAGMHADQGCEACAAAVDRVRVCAWEPAYVVHWQDFEPTVRDRVGSRP